MTQPRTISRSIKHDGKGGMDTREATTTATKKVVLVEKSMIQNIDYPCNYRNITAVVHIIHHTYIRVPVVSSPHCFPLAMRWACADTADSSMRQAGTTPSTPRYNN